MTLRPCPLRPCHFRDELRRFPPGIVSLVGAGGKTSLLRALGASLAAAGERVLCTTTTRLFRPDPTPELPVALEDDPRQLPPLSTGALLAARPSPPGENPRKVCGYSAQEVDALWQRGYAPWIMVEADGAKGCAIKAPAAHEPVIPSCTAWVVGLLGLGCLNHPCAPERVFRMERFCAVTGCAPGDPLTPRVAARLIAHPWGLFAGAPPTARRLLFCNQADLPGALDAFAELAAMIRGTSPDLLEGCYAGSLQKDGLRCYAWEG